MVTTIKILNISITSEIDLLSWSLQKFMNSCVQVGWGDSGDQVALEAGLEGLVERTR